MATNLSVKYKSPKIVKAKRGWFIALYYEYPNNPGKYKRFEISAGINYLHDLQEREAAFLELRKELVKALESGFDPFFTGMEAEFVRETETKAEELKEKESSWTITEGIIRFQDYCKKINLSDNTVRTYNTFINNFSSWLEENELTNLIAAELTESSIDEFLDQQFDEENWTPRTYNNHLKFFNTLFSRMEKLEKRENNKLKGYKVDL